MPEQSQSRMVRVEYWSSTSEPEVLDSVFDVMRVVPTVGPYWRGQRAAQVLDVHEEDGLTVVEVAADDERNDAFYRLLPDGALIEARRDVDTGDWHAEVYESDVARRSDPDAALGSAGFESECDAVVRLAIGRALERIERR